VLFCYRTCRCCLSLLLRSWSSCCIHRVDLQSLIVLSDLSLLLVSVAEIVIQLLLASCWCAWCYFLIVLVCVGQLLCHRLCCFCLLLRRWSSCRMHRVDLPGVILLSYLSLLLVSVAETMIQLPHALCWFAGCYSLIVLVSVACLCCWDDDPAAACIV